MTQLESVLRAAIAALDDAGVGFGVSALVEQNATGRLATVRLAPADAPEGGVIVLLFASSGVEPEIVSAAEPIEILPSLVVPVARVGHLIALKLLARDDVTRPQDTVDLRALLRCASPAELTLARDAIALITSRGFNRGRDLSAALDDVGLGLV
jgi:hypothetical protein